MFFSNPISFEGSFHLKQIFKKENMLKIFCSLIICCVFSIIIYSFIHFIILPSMPVYTAREYANCLNNKDYVKAQAFFTNVPDIERLKKEDINRALEDTFKDARDFKVIEAKDGSGSEVYGAALEFTKSGVRLSRPISLKNTGSSFLGLKKEWKVDFPFTTVDLQASGIDGIKIYMDGSYIGMVRDGKLDIKSVICGPHIFNAELDDIGYMGDTSIDVGDETSRIEFQTIPTEKFRKDMESLITNFCDSWSSYCLSQDPSVMKPYLTDRLYKKYADDSGIFSGSKFTICKYTIEFKNLAIENGLNVSLVVDENWHLKEEITDPGLIFTANGKNSLEQEQKMTWKYHISKSSDSWKLDGAEQISFEQKIIN